jgi:HAD superfamily phosphoserine phosphatase-like hydrolase
MPGDARIDDIIELYKVPDRNGVYVLGCFARYATLYSQQVRALNLIYLLNQKNEICAGKSVVVIGAGAAGLSAAVAAARVGAHVTVLEKLAAPMGIQRKSLERYIHPHIYDWPLTQITSTNAGLPVLSWSAGYADAVANGFIDDWDVERKRYPDQLVLNPDVLNVEIGPMLSSYDDKVTVTWYADRPRGETFDVVILAVGFGLERHKWADDRGYWHNDQLDKEDGIDKKCLVSGYGDGGLTDLMRLCIKNFQHDSFLKLFADHPNSRMLGDELIRMERRYLNNFDRREISNYYQNLDVPHVRQVLLEKKMLRDHRQVYLTGTDFWAIYSSKSSILNRLIVSQLAQLGRWQWLRGPIESPTRDAASGQYKVRFKKDGKTKDRGKSSRNERLFDIVVLRHGPEPALRADFPDIWDACDALAKRWRTMPPLADPTRAPLPWGTLFDPPIRSPSASVTPPRPDQFKLVAFDIDGTLLQGDYYKWSWPLVWSHLGYSDNDRRDLMNKYLQVIKAGGSGWHDAYRKWCDESAVHFKRQGLKRSDFAAITSGLRPVIGLRETIRQLKAAGMKLAIISGGIDQFITEKLSDYQDEFDYVHVNKFLFDGEGLFTRIEPTHYDFKGKLNAVLEICGNSGLTTEQVVFVGDGFNDVALVGKVGRTICFAATDSTFQQGADVNIPRTTQEPDLRAILEHVLPQNRAGDDEK